MGTNNHIDELNSLFERYKGLIFLHRKCSLEIIDLIVGSGIESDFIAFLAEKFDQLIHDDFNSFNRHFEKLQGQNCNNLRSMKYRKQKNIRIIFSKTKDGSILLVAFHEKFGSRVSEYDNYIPKAQKRLEEIIGE